MKLKNNYYTYPVLKIDSPFYEKSKFDIDVNIANEVFNVVFTFNASIYNDKLMNMLNHDEVKLVYHIECPKTSFRQSFSTNDISFVASIPTGYVDERVEVNSFLVANHDIIGYDNDDFASDFRGFSFDIPRGCPVAIGEGYLFDITKAHDELKDTASIFSIIPIEDPMFNSVEYKLDGQKILICLPKEVHQKYAILSSNIELQSVMHSMLIVPGLIYILNVLQSNDDYNEYDSCRWFRALRKACELQKVDISNLADVDVVNLAQKLIDNPIKKSFEYLYNDTLGMIDDET